MMACQNRLTETASVLAGLLLVVLCGGCGEPSAPDAASPTLPANDEPQIVVISDPTTELGSSEASHESAADAEPSARGMAADMPIADATDASADTSSTSTAAEDDLPEDAPAKDAPAEHAPAKDDSSEESVQDASVRTVHRLYVPTTAGTILVDLQIRVDGQPIAAFLDQQLDRLQARITTEKRLDWTELVDFAEQNTALFPAGLNVTDETAERFDRNANRVVEREELRRWLLSANNGGRLVRVQTDDRYRHRNRCESAVFAALDTDDDSVVDETQYRNAAEALLRLDRNFDQRLDAEEWIVDAAPPGMSAARAAISGAALVLQDVRRWDRLAYSAASDLRAAPFGLPPLLSRVDADDDQQLTTEETHQLNDGPPHLVWSIDFSTDPTAAPTLTLHASQDGLESKIRVSDGAVAVVDPSLQLSLSVEDAWSRMGATGPDPLPLWLSYVSIRCGEASDAWFHWLDRDSSGYLSSRELQQAGARIGELAEGNPVDCGEVPDAYTITVRRSPEAMSAQPAAMQRIAAPRRSQLPPWAAPMDRNSDGDVSRLEFIGSAAQFDRLDHDTDGFIDVVEARRAAEL